MYQKKFSNRNKGGESRFSSPHRSTRPSGRSGGARFARPKAKQSHGSYIHPSKFVNKAEPTIEQAVFTPQHQFTDFAIQPALKTAIVHKGYKTPTPIQDASIAPILDGQDVIGIANTGTGKTAAFLVPLINKVLLDPRQQALIIVPTRELATQIDQELKGFVHGMRIYSVCVVGGAAIGPQISQLNRKYNFIIGTPGRLKDLIERGKIKLAHFQTVVLDEADRMLDMGFINDMRYVMRGMPAQRHTLFFSATLSPEIEKLIGEFMPERDGKRPARISVKTGDTSKNVDQDIVQIENGTSKLDALHGLLSKEDFKKVLVFGRTKHGVEKLSHALQQRGVASDSIHGNKSHSQRARSLSKFKAGEVKVLVATDVAARGLDIAGISHVINYDLPTTYEDYVHRIGRTGRGDMKGKALTFVENK
jgi:ATP-dependent RNA helicase RhlE